jgi:hypothetical protein
MSKKDEEIIDLKGRITKIEEFQKHLEIEEGVKAAIKIRCALAWSSILGFVAVISFFINLYSHTVKEASKAALKVIMENFK